jgi:hypothetical protein
MRFSATLVVCAGLLTVAGCDTTDKVFFREGIGTELSYGEIEASTSAQNEYVKRICQQAGLAYDETAVSCEPATPATWQLFVQAGMNDIDQRCDAYLQWLDYVRRAKDPTLRVFSDAATYSALIMDRSGVSAAPIAITAAALGFARNTFSNVTSRLILEVNHSAVQSVVLSFQKQYREELFGTGEIKRTPVVIASKPAAIYALRSYLRMCMPVTIEAEINNTVVTFARGGPEALYEQRPLVSAETVGPALVIRSLAIDDSILRLHAQLYPGGSKEMDPDLKKFVVGLFKPRTAVAVYLKESQYVSMRRRISACIDNRGKGPGKECEPESLSKIK